MCFADKHLVCFAICHVGGNLGLLHFRRNDEAVQPCRNFCCDRGSEALRIPLSNVHKTSAPDLLRDKRCEFKLLRTICASCFLSSKAFIHGGCHTFRTLLARSERHAKHGTVNNQAVVKRQSKSRSALSTLGSAIRIFWLSTSYLGAVGVRNSSHQMNSKS